MISRRGFIAGLAGGSITQTHAQNVSVPVIGFLESGSPANFERRAAAFREGLGETGYIEHRNVTIEYRWVDGRYDRLPAFAVELVRRPVAVLVATGAPNSAQAALAATKTIPIIFANGGDPVRLGLVSHLHRPGGNATGVTFFNSVLGPKRLELAHALLPTATAVGFLVNPNNANSESDKAETRAAATVLGLNIVSVAAGDEREFEAAFATIVERRAGGLIVNNDSFFSTRLETLVALAARYHVPTIYYSRDYVAAGGLASYGSNVANAYREVGVYVGRILNGTKPAELPVLQPTTFELVVNLKTAKALGLTIPPALVQRANEVIE